MTQTITIFRPRPTDHSLDATAALLQVVGQARRAQDGLFRQPATISLEYLVTADTVRYQFVSPNRRRAELLSHELRIWYPAAEIPQRVGRRGAQRGVSQGTVGSPCSGEGPRERAGAP